MGRRKMSDEERAQKETAILDAAAKVFGEHGFSDVGMRDIASELNMTTSQIYKIFPDKQTLYDRTCEQIYSQYSTNVREAIEGIEDPKECLSVFALWLMNFLLHNQIPSRLIQRQLLEDNVEGFRQLTGKQFGSTFQNLVEWMTALTGKETAVMRAYSLLAYANGLSHLRVIPRSIGKRIPPLRNAQHLANMVLKSVVPEVYGPQRW